ncbi:MAG: glycosyltransferase [Rhodobacteraceae bacterium]|nr:glycosyltransferase [Paracoccaceae bacterium]
MVEIAIILPVWHHPALVSEAIASCLAQVDAPDFQMIVVNDGCDLPETAHVLEGWRQAHPDKITVLTQTNRGLSAARNSGIEYALKALPDLRGYFFLDADNRLEPGALALFGRLLDSDNKAGWFYPQFDMFGVSSNRNSGGEYSLSRLAFSNFCDAGSLVRAEVIQAGIRFDEGLKSGYEDWDFWLSAAGQGFYGAPVKQSYLGYRKRPDSMLSGAHQEADLIFNQLKTKHKWLYEGQFLNDLWLKEWPRISFVEADESGPVTGFLRWRARPFESNFAPALVFYAPQVFEKLRELKLLDSVVYQLEGALRSTPIAGVFTKKSAALGFEHIGNRFDGTGTMLENCGIIAISRHHIDEALKCDGLIEMITYLIGDVLVSKHQLTLPEALETSDSPLAALVNFISELAESPMRNMGKKQLENWRQPAEIIWPNAIGWQIEKANLNGRPAMQPRNPGQHIGFAVPVFQFGGVEKCVVALARELTIKGLHCHLFIYGIDAATDANWMYEPFESVSIITDPRLRDWRGATYLGTTGAAKPDDRLFGDILGPLTAMDAVVNCGTGMLHHGAAALRSKGVKTVSWEHLSETSHYGRMVGTPFVALAHEAGYDHIATCSAALATRLAGHGIPHDKLMPLPNGPGFPAKPSPRQPLTGPLRVGFLGRFDHQKAVDRFVEIAIRLRGADFVFQICGSGVLDAEVNFPDWLDVSPPVLDPADISAFFAGIDVLVLPSRNEGLPLTILEAQRAGVVTLASNVGAVDEAIIDGKTGILLAPDTVVDTAVACLQTLNADRDLVLKIAQNAAGKPDNWQQNAKQFIKAVFE